MIALVQIGVQKERGNAVIVERVMIGIGHHLPGEIQRQAAVLVAQARHSPQTGGRARTENEHALGPQRADHVEIEHEFDAAQRQGRIGRPMFRAQQALLLAVEANEQDRSPGSNRHAGKGPGQFEDARSAAGIIVGAGIDRPRRVVVAGATMAQMIVMGAHDDRLILECGIAPRQQGEDVAVVIAERLEVALFSPAGFSGNLRNCSTR